jgi:hypothetical protein
LEGLVKIVYFAAKIKNNIIKEDYEKVCNGIYEHAPDGIG